MARHQLCRSKSSLDLLISPQLISDDENDMWSTTPGMYQFRRTLSCQQSRSYRSQHGGPAFSEAWRSGLTFRSSRTANLMSSITLSWHRILQPNSTRPSLQIGNKLSRFNLLCICKHWASILLSCRKAIFPSIREENMCPFKTHCRRRAMRSSHWEGRKSLRLIYGIGRS